MFARIEQALPWATWIISDRVRSRSLSRPAGAELGDEALEDSRELRVMLPGTGAGEFGDFAVAVCSLPPIATCLANHAEAVVSIVDFRIALQ